MIQNHHYIIFYIYGLVSYITTFNTPKKPYETRGYGHPGGKLEAADQIPFLQILEIPILGTQFKNRLNAL